MTGSGSGAPGTESVSSWLELESDPGLFTLLVDDFGVKGAQVEEVYDLTKPLDNSIFGFIFLFKWIERRGRRSKSSNLEPNSNYVTDSNVVNNMFFAHQIVPNSCATHALLSVLLNCKLNKYLNLGELLEKFKKLCDGLTPEIKGLAIGNQPRLAQAHNSYAKPESTIRTSYSSCLLSKTYNSSIASSSSLASSSSQSCSSNLISTNSSLIGSGSQIAISNNNTEIFHFICFVPINGRLYELDGLKPFPVDHGPIPINSSNYNNQMLEQLINLNQLNNLGQIINNLAINYLSHFDPGTYNWTNKFKQIILQRLSSFNNGQQNHEIRFNLMAVVPDKMFIVKDQIDLLNENKKLINFLINNENDMYISESDLLNDSSRQLRSSKQSLKLLKKDQFELVFNLFENDFIKSLIQVAKLNKSDLLKLIDKFELIELVKMFKINLLNDDSNQETTFYVKKNCNLNDLRIIEGKLNNEIEQEQVKLNEELDKRKRYKIEALRRKHLYDEFILTYLKILAENGKLEEIVRNSLKPNQFKIEPQHTNSTQSNTNSSFYISPHSLFLQQSMSKKQRKK